MRPKCMQHFRIIDNPYSLASAVQLGLRLRTPHPVKLEEPH